MRTRLALSAALPLVAALAACSTGNGTGTGAPAGPSPTGSVSSPAQDVHNRSSTDDRSDGTTVTGVQHSSPSTAVPRRPTVKDALDTVRSYLRREIGMVDPRTGPFRWTGSETGEVDVRSAAGGERLLGPATTVSVRRLRTVWFVTGARTEGIKVDTRSLTGRVSSPLRVSGRLSGRGPWRITVAQDRYGKDPVLGGRLLVPERSGPVATFREALSFDGPTAGTGSVIISEDVPGGGLGVLRATVVRVQFARRVPPPLPCSPAAILPVLKSWLDDPENEAVIVKAEVLRCRNGYVHVIAVPRANPPGHSQLDAVQVFMQQRNGQWTSLDVGTGIGCGGDDQPADKVLQKACDALGYTH